MNRHAQMRQMHRWLSIGFTAAVAVTSVSLALGMSVDWVSTLPLAPLLLLLVTGLYLFVRPHVGRVRARDRHES